jgi:hypothetical protein
MSNDRPALKQETMKRVQIKKSPTDRLSQDVLSVGLNLSVGDFLLAARPCKFYNANHRFNFTQNTLSGKTLNKSRKSFRSEIPPN